MKTIIANGLLAALLFGVSALAAEACEVEDWRWSGGLPGMTMIEGTTTCSDGWIIVRAYDGGDNYLGNATTVIDGFAFTAFVSAAASSDIRIKYIIKDDPF